MGDKIEHGRNIIPNDGVDDTEKMPISPRNTRGSGREDVKALIKRTDIIEKSVVRKPRRNSWLMLAGYLPIEQSIYFTTVTLLCVRVQREEARR